MKSPDRKLADGNSSSTSAVNMTLDHDHQLGSLQEQFVSNSIGHTRRHPCGNSGENNLRNCSPSTSVPLATPATTLSMASDAETTSAPTVKNSEKDSNDIDLPQAEDGENLSNPIEGVCCDGDLLLNIRRSGGTTTIAGTNNVNNPIAPIIVRLRVSSAILRVASMPLRRLLDTPTITQSSVPSMSGKHQSRQFVIYQHPGNDPSFWGYREGKGIFSLVVNSEIPVEELKQAMLLVFKILHHNDEIHQGGTPTLLQASWVAEIAWVLHCVSPMVPWIKSWLSVGGESVDAEVQLVSRLILAFVLGDSEVFKNASYQWLFSRPHMTEILDKRERWSLVVLTIIYADLQGKRADLTRGLSNVVSSTLFQYSRKDTPTFIIGAILHSLQEFSTEGFEPYYALNPDNLRVRVRFTWQLATDDQSIYTLIANFLRITSGFNYNLPLWDYGKAVEKFATCVVAEVENLKGLKLEEYRAPVIKKLDVDSCVGDIIVKRNWEFEELKRYGRGDYGGVLFWLSKLVVEYSEKLIRYWGDYSVLETLVRIVPPKPEMRHYVGVVVSSGEGCLSELQKLKRDPMARLEVLWGWIAAHVLSARENMKRIDFKVYRQQVSQMFTVYMPDPDSYFDKIIHKTRATNMGRYTTPTAIHRSPAPRTTSHRTHAHDHSQTIEEKPDKLPVTNSWCWFRLSVGICILLVVVVMGLNMSISSTCSKPVLGSAKNKCQKEGSGWGGNTRHQSWISYGNSWPSSGAGKKNQQGWQSFHSKSAYTNQPSSKDSKKTKEERTPKRRNQKREKTEKKEEKRPHGGGVWRGLKKGAGGIFREILRR